MRSSHVCGAVVMILVCLVAAPAFAGFPATDTFVASVGRGPGQVGSQWYTTIWIYNPDSSSANVQLTFLLRDQANPASPYVFNDSVPAGDTKRYDNVVQNLFGLSSAFGAIHVVSNRSMVVNSRIYSTPAGKTDDLSAGQFFAAVPASFAIAAGQSTQLLGVYQTTPADSSLYRYNFGFVETVGAAASVRVTVLDASGMELGHLDYIVGAYEVRQYGVASQFPSISTTNARLRIAVTSGAGKVVAFGSGLANTSNDPSTFEMSFDPALLGSATSSVAHDTTLTGDGTGGSPLGIAVPLSLSSSSSSAPTIRGETSGGETSGVKGVCTDGCVGVEGLQTQSGNYGYLGWVFGGVFGSSQTAVGVRGESNTGVGVAGTSESNVGVSGGSTSGTGVKGVHEGTTGEAPAIYGETASTEQLASAVDGFVSSTNPGANSAAVRGRNGGTSGNGFGVWGSHDGTGVGVLGTSDDGIGVMGVSTIRTGVSGITGATGNGVNARSSGSARANAALRADNDNTSGGMAAYLTNRSNYATAHLANAGTGEVLYLQANGGYLIKAVNNAENNTLFSVDSAGNVRADGTFASPAADFAELLPAEGTLESGDLVTIGPDGLLRASDTPYQTTVAGIYSTRPAFLGGSDDGPSGRVPLAIVGIVPVKASAENGAITPGDLLVASATPGHVMRCDDRLRCIGGIVGKALSRLAEGSGKITALVSLH